MPQRRRPRASRERGPRGESDEGEGVGLLAEGAGRASPFASPSTQYFILGDGRARRALGAVRRAAVTPVVPIVTIDPEYNAGTAPRTKGRKPAAKYRSTNRVQYRGLKAEKYRFDRAALARVENLVIVAVRSHAKVGAFVSRARAAAGHRVRVFALCATCCGTPGLRRASERVEGRAAWQLLYPAGTARPGRRPRLQAARAGQKARRRTAQRYGLRVSRLWKLSRQRARRRAPPAKKRRAPPAKKRRAPPAKKRRAPPPRRRI